MLDVNTLTVTQLIDLVHQEHKDHQDREAEIRDLEFQILTLNSEIYRVNQRGEKYLSDGPMYLKALLEATKPT